MSFAENHPPRNRRQVELIQIRRVVELGGSKPIADRWS
jgi:hypothetical protein